MDDKMITAKELQAALDRELHEMFQEVATANAKFKQKIYQKALDLLQHKQGAFSPSTEVE